MLSHSLQRLLASGQAHSAALLGTMLVSDDDDNDDEAQATRVQRAEALFAVRDFAGVMRVVAAAATADDDAHDEATLRRLAMRAAFELGDVAAAQQNAQAVLSCGDDDGVGEALCCLGKCAELADQPARAAAHYAEALQHDLLCAEAMHALVERRLLDTTALLALVDSLPLCGGDKQSDSSKLALRVRDGYRAMVLARASTHTTTTLRGTSDDDDGDAQVYLAHAPRAARLLCEAQRHWACNRLQHALHVTSALMHAHANDGASREVVCLHLAVLVDLKATPQLFEVARALAQPRASASCELAVYAIGCFYYASGNYERAGRYFSRATELDRFFAEACLAYGHCYAKLEEGEQALGVYRACLARFPGVDVSGVYMGMQYARMHQRALARRFLSDALQTSPQHVLALNEMGVLHVHRGRLHDALHCLTRARDALPCGEAPCEYHDCVVYNLATVLRKLGRYAEAVVHYTRYVHCRPHASYAHAALGFTHHLAGAVDVAIAHYHHAYSLHADEFYRELLERALVHDAVVLRGSDATPVRRESNAGEVSWSAAARAVHSGAVTC